MMQQGLLFGGPTTTTDRNQWERFDE